jgi:hypothetical protein
MDDAMVAPPSRKSFLVRPEMVWVQREHFMGWACSECAWEFNPSRIPAGNTLAEIKQQYERERDKEFASHVCAEHRKCSEGASRDEQRKPTSHDRKSGIGLVLAGPAPNPNSRNLRPRLPSAAPERAGSLRLE